MPPLSWGASAKAECTLWLMPARRETITAQATLELGQTPVSERSYYSRTQLRRDHDADSSLRAAISERFAAVGGLSVEHDWRRVSVHGDRAALTRAVTKLKASPLAPSIVGILGLEPTAPLRANNSVSQPHSNSGHAIADVAKAYRFPAQRTGRGQTIGVISFSGAWHHSDLESAMRSAKLPMPMVCYAVPVAQRSSDDLELALDTQILATVANGATLALYAGRNDAWGYADAIARALLDVERAPQIISLSYGVPEAVWPPAALRCIEQLLIAAAHCGVSVVVASGDAGSPLVDGVAQVDYPAASRFVLACGGTDLQLNDGRRERERVWNEGRRSSGGGYSRIFERTPWALQRGAHGRGVPDVAAHAAALHGYRVHVDGRIVHIGGTSAAAPLWAGLLALINEGAALPCGFITPRLYARHLPPLFFDVTVGGNGRYDARPGWDACTGLGAPHGDALLHMLREADTALLV